jgi:serine/threonine-protein kinase
VLDSRYRVVGLLGRGGMGEVYRADDLRLGQSVALKFLPPELSRDASRLAQFHNEVRTARQVSHPNVCRVYDIGEIDHQIYLSMEYVDGEDLASLLRRIGRLPEDKATEIARQICAGLAAAHSRRIVHRDLKPANIMLDGSGRARIMDFSLAAVGAVTDIRSGTPAYMAPEQLAGKEVTARSDIYALGLVLYELFTGRRAYDAKNLGELIEQHASGTITAPTDVVKTLDQTIERAIQRCLEDDPARRPPTALAVAASLPGGDPMAAALAAGETPSPEMVAAVGGDAATVSPLAGAGWLALAVAMVLAVASLGDRASLLSKTPFSKPPAVLADRAEQIREALGYTDPPADSTSDFAVASGYLDWAARNGAGKDHWAVLAGARPAPVRFWYRTSPGPLVPRHPQSPITESDPAVTIAGMTLVEVDMLGRLWSFNAAPPEVESPMTGEPRRVDWAPVFNAAGLDASTFKEVAPARTPPTFADERRAWEGVLPGTQQAIRFEGAGYRGRVVSFHEIGPWTQASRDSHETTSSSGNTAGSIIFVLILLVVAAVLARANLKSGRADRRGAFRLAVFAAFLLVGIWAGLDHVRDISEERNRMFDGIALAMFVGGAMYLIYLALEPFVRRGWPTLLVGWSRVLGGQLRDPTVGRDLLRGTAAGIGYALLGLGYNSWRLSQGTNQIPWTPDPSLTINARQWLLGLFGSLNSGMQNGLISLLVFMLLREFVRLNAARLGRRGPAIDRASTIISLAIGVLMSVLTSSGDTSAIVYGAVTSLIEVLLLLWLGLLSSCVMFSVNFVLGRVPLTLDGSRFYATEAWMTMAIVLAVAAVGFWLARADEPLFSVRAARTEPRRTAA